MNHSTGARPTTAVPWPKSQPCGLLRRGIAFRVSGTALSTAMAAELERYPDPGSAPLKTDDPREGLWLRVERSAHLSTLGA